jgi:hypothetical protein
MTSPGHLAPSELKVRSPTLNIALWQEVTRSTHSHVVRPDLGRRSGKNVEIVLQPRPSRDPNDPLVSSEVGSL